MRAHELARKLLEGPDLVVLDADTGGVYLLTDVKPCEITDEQGTERYVGVFFDQR